MFVFCFFFFQAEDGIRDVAVTGVQTCALPIWCSSRNSATNSCSPGSSSAASTSKGQIGRAHVLNSSHGYISYAVFCLNKKCLTHFFTAIAGHRTPTRALDGGPVSPRNSSASYLGIPPQPPGST